MGFVTVTDLSRTSVVCAWDSGNVRESHTVSLISRLWVSTVGPEVYRPSACQ